MGSSCSILHCFAVITLLRLMQRWSYRRKTFHKWLFMVNQSLFCIKGPWSAGLHFLSSSNTGFHTGTIYGFSGSTSMGFSTHNSLTWKLGLRLSLFLLTSTHHPRWSAPHGLSMFYQVIDTSTYIVYVKSRMVVHLKKINWERSLNEEILSCISKQFLICHVLMGSHKSKREAEKNNVDFSLIIIRKKSFSGALATSNLFEHPRYVSYLEQYTDSPGRL